MIEKLSCTALLLSTPVQMSEPGAEQLSELKTGQTCYSWRDFRTITITVSPLGPLPSSFVCDQNLRLPLSFSANFSVSGKTQVSSCCKPRPVSNHKGIKVSESRLYSNLETKFGFLQSTLHGQKYSHT